MSNHFNKTGGLRPSRSVFDLSYRKLLTCDMGELIPILMDEAVPGDKFKIGNEIVIRMNPMVAPVMHEINAYVHYYFVPYRILWDDWEKFISGGVDGQFNEPIPRWNTSNTAKGSLWDFLGLPVGVSPTDALPLDFPRRAYNKIWNEYYRDETLQTELADNSEVICKRAWEKDYFTASLTQQQRGIAPALPISGTTSAVFPAGLLPIIYRGTAITGNELKSNRVDATNWGDVSDMITDSNTADSNYVQYVADLTKAMLDNNTVDFSNASTFNVSDLRLAFQIQKWMERNERAGVRYTEFLREHFGVFPRDERLQRPEYLGGSKSPVIISEVLQTSSTDEETPQGNMAGHGITVDRNFCVNYEVKEYGVMVGLMSIMPRTMYMQGVNRQWLRRTKYDFYFPEFANLSEQAIERAEIYATDNAVSNRTIFGYQGRYDEMRVKQSMVCGEFRDTLDYWHLGRKFSSAPALNSTFISCDASKRIFAVQNEPGFLVNVGNKITAIRPLPIIAEPGLIDHH